MSTSLRRTITALVQDKPGVLNRITSMFRRRNFNISSLAVGQSEKPNLSRMTFVVEGDNTVVEQLLKNLRKLVDVIKVSAAPDEDVVSREFALIRVSATPATRKEIVQIADIFRANIVGVSPDSMIIEVAGDADKMSSLQDLLKSYGLLEVMRTGTIVMYRGKSA
jgi:acetolactate synthase-1/3 small subunit